MDVRHLDPKLECYLMRQKHREEGLQMLYNTDDVTFSPCVSGFTDAMEVYM